MKQKKNRLARAKEKVMIAQATCKVEQRSSKRSNQRHFPLKFAKKKHVKLSHCLITSRVQVIKVKKNALSLLNLACC